MSGQMVYNFCPVWQGRRVSTQYEQLVRNIEKYFTFFSVSNSQNRSDEDENKEPPNKKEKSMEPLKKPGKLSLKQKNSKPLSNENK